MIVESFHSIGINPSQLPFPPHDKAAIDQFSTLSIFSKYRRETQYVQVPVPK